MCLSQDKIQRPVNMASLAIALQDILKRKNVWPKSRSPTQETQQNQQPKPILPHGYLRNFLRRRRPQFELGYLSVIHQKNV